MAGAQARLAGRNPGIDLVRGVSILLVVIHHTALRIPLAKTGLASVLPDRLLTGLSWDGYEAVFVFFVVSGFLITGNALARWGGLRGLDLRAFYARRAARILPCLLVLVALLSVLDLLRTPNYMIEGAGQSLPRAVFSASAMHLNWYEGRTGYLPGGWDVLWSLSIEEVFYLGFPLICLTLGRWRAGFTISLCCLALSLPWVLGALAGASEIWREKAYLPGMAAIAMGVCAAVFVSRVRAPGSFIAGCIGWLGTGMIGAMFWREDLFYQVAGNGAMLVLTFSVALLMVAFHWGWGRVRARSGTGWLRSFGVMSYEIYLTHMFVVFSVIGVFHSSGGFMRLGWVWFIPVLLISWGSGWVVQRFVSLPADRWLRERLVQGDGGSVSGFAC